MKIVFAFHVVERRYVERFGNSEALLEPANRLRPIAEHVEVTFAVGVIDLGYDILDVARWVVTVVETHGVEDVVKIPGRGD
jgi:hypothetical protein